jgi:signal transduction histidine kinase
MRCPKCESEQPETVSFCSECGSELEPRGSKFGASDPRGDAGRLEPAHEADLIHHLITCLPKTMDLDHFLRVVTAELVKELDVQTAGVLLYDESLNDFSWREVHDKSPLAMLDASEKELGLDRAAIDRAFQTGDPLVVGNAGGSARRIDGEAHDESLIRDALLVPLNTREKTRGLLVLVNKKTGGFTEEDIRVGLSIAGMVALSVENADFFEGLLDSYRKVAGLERIKSKILNRLSHELQTPLAIVTGTVKTMESKLRQKGIGDFDAALVRLNRQVQNLSRLEIQVESIMERGYAEQREMISGLLESAASLIEVQVEQTPEIERAAALMLRTLEAAFPANREQWRRLNIKEFGESVLDYVRDEVARQNRRLNLTFDLHNGSEALIPDLVLHAIIEGLVRNAVEATPDDGLVTVRGRPRGDLYVLRVEDSGFGIPEEDWGLVLEGFYQVQETDSYTSGKPYSFNAGGKGMDLFRIKMFAKIYGLGLYFKSHRCAYLTESLRECPGSLDRCLYCSSLQDCVDSGGTVFEVELPLARGKHIL